MSRPSIHIDLRLTTQCIDQHSGNDKSHQIGQMGAIYANSEVTLFAVTGHNPSHGLAGVSVPQRSACVTSTVGPIEIRGVDETYVKFSYDWNPIKDIEMSKWASRAWTLQESYLSRRRLYFTERRIFFACNSDFHCESGIDNRAGTWGNLGDVMKRLGAFACCGWPGRDPDILDTIIEAYSRRQLRYDDDALDAMSGMLTALTSPGKPGSEYSHLWGVVFKKTGVSCESLRIQWKMLSPGHRRTAFPSWSPLRWSGPFELGRSYLLASDTSTIQIWVNRQWVPW